MEPLILEKPCLVCASMFSFRNSRAMYCSQSCKNKAFTARNPLSAEERKKKCAITKAWKAENPDKHHAQQKILRDRKRGAPPRPKLTEEQRTELHKKRRARAYAKRRSGGPHAEAHAASARDRNARLRGSAGKVRPGLRNELMHLQRGRCAACKKKLEPGRIHMDHVMPLRLGGEHANGNLQLLCVTCNCSKNAKHPVDFMQRMGFLC